MRLIDADALLAEYDRQHEGEPGKARKLIEDAPTINRPTRSQFKRMAVQLGYEPVVHCKDCRLGEPDMIVNGYKDEVWCNYYEHPKPAYGVCEKGKRKANEQYSEKAPPHTDDEHHQGDHCRGGHVRVGVDGLLPP